MHSLVSQYHSIKIYQVIYRNKRWAFLTLLLFFVAIIASRMPELIYAPRFWAEEGRHFETAFNRGFLEGLCYVYWRAGYFNLITNIGTAFASLLPLRFSPFFTVYLSLAVQVLPIALVLIASGRLFDGFQRKAAWCLALLLIPTMKAEVWLNSINSQIFLGIAALVILLDESRRDSLPRQGLRWATLILSGLSGPYAIFLQPAFLLRAAIDRYREQLVHAAIITSTLIFQLVIVIMSISHGVMNDKRLFFFNWQSLAAASVWHVSFPILGEHMRGIGIRWIYLFAEGIFVILAVSLWNAEKHRFRLERGQMFLLSVYACWLIGIGLTAHHGTIGERYAVAPSLVIVVLLMSGIQHTALKAARTILVLLLIFGLYNGLSDYRMRPECCGTYPKDWRRAVAVWESVPSNPLPICPEGWSMKLSSPTKVEP